MTVPGYTPEALRELLRRHHLTGSAAGRMLGVGSRAIRKWTAHRGAENATTMPESAWWLLLILMGELRVADLLAHVRQQADDEPSGRD